MSNAGGPYAGTVGVAVAFNGSGSTDPQNEALTYAWNFGDNATGSGANPTHNYTAPGTYTVTLTVTNTSSLSASTATTATIAAAPPVANAGGPYTGIIGTSLTFNGASSTDPQGESLTYAWNFGDGATGAGARSTHVYTVVGTYTVSLTVTNSSNLANTAAGTATVTSPMTATLASVGPNTSNVATTAANYGATTIETLAYGNPYRIRTSGTVTAVQFNYHPGTSASHIYIRFWTQNGDNVNNFDLNCSTEDLLTDALVDGINTVTLASSCPVTAGDFWSVYVVNASGSPLDTYSDAYANSFADTSGFAQTPALNHVFQTTNTSGANLPAILNLYENRYPLLVAIGDSEQDGFPAMSDYFEKSGYSSPIYVSTALENQYPNYVAQQQGWTMADLSEAGTISTAFLYVLQTYVVPLHPEVVLVGLTRNDLIDGVPFSTTMSNFSAIISAAASATPPITVVMTSVNTYYGATTADSEALDQMNTLSSLCVQPACLWVDERPFLNQYQPGGPAGNLWNIQPELYFGDGVHFNAQGQQIRATLTVNALRKANFLAAPLVRTSAPTTPSPQ